MFEKKGLKWWLLHCRTRAAKAGAPPTPAGAAARISETLLMMAQHYVLAFGETGLAPEANAGPGGA